MKAKRTHCFIGYLIVISNLFSCGNLDDFELPELKIEEPQIMANSDILAIKSAYNQSGQNYYTFKSDDTTIIEAYIISSDEGQKTLSVWQQ